MAFSRQRIVSRPKSGRPAPFARRRGAKCIPDNTHAVSFIFLQTGPLQRILFDPHQLGFADVGYHVLQVAEGDFGGQLYTGWYDLPLANFTIRRNPNHHQLQQQRFKSFPLTWPCFRIVGTDIGVYDGQQSNTTNHHREIQLSSNPMMDSRSLDLRQSWELGRTRSLFLAFECWTANAVR